MTKRASNDKHFGNEDWADFANGQVHGERKEAMQRHLTAGCKACSNALALWTRVSETARRESAFQPPDSALRHVRAAFSMLAEKKHRKAFEVPKLVFDSLWQPAMAGVRSTLSAPRQVLYRAGDFAVEMRIEPEPNSERVNIAGQVSKANPQTQGLVKIPVIVSSPKGKLSDTRTNDFGEFQIAVVPSAGLCISFEVEKEREVSIPLESAGIATFYRY
jgi:hypothetical protein